MNILVCISIIPDTTFDLNLTENDKIDFSEINFIINPIDEFSLSKIISLRNNSDFNISVLNVGLSENDSILRKCLAIGVDNVFRINHDSKESFIVAKSISEFIKEHDFDVIVFGKESLDFNGSCVHGIVSGFTNINFIPNVVDINISDSIILDLESQNGIFKIKTKTPVIISTQKGILNEEDLIIPNIRGIMASKKKEISILNYSHLQISQITNYQKISTDKECKIIEPEQFIDILKVNNIL